MQYHRIHTRTQYTLERHVPNRLCDTYTCTPRPYRMKRKNLYSNISRSDRWRWSLTSKQPSQSHKTVKASLVCIDQFSYTRTVQRYASRDLTLPSLEWNKKEERNKLKSDCQQKHRTRKFSKIKKKNWQSQIASIFQINQEQHTRTFTTFIVGI